MVLFTSMGGIDWRDSKQRKSRVSYFFPPWTMVIARSGDDKLRFKEYIRIEVTYKLTSEHYLGRVLGNHR